MLRWAPTRWVLLATLVAVSYFTFAAVTNAVQTHRLQQDDQRLREEITQLSETYWRLTGLAAYMSSDEYVESVARGQLGLVRPGETQIAVAPTVEAGGGEGTAPPRGWWWRKVLGR